MNLCQAPVSAAAAGGAGNLVVGDFNLDGKLDVALPGAVFLGNGVGTFQKPFLLEPETGLSIVSGDFNRDGIPDLAVTTYQDLTVWLGLGDGTFQKSFFYQMTTTASILFSLVTGDFDSDGEADLLVDGYHQRWVFLGHGDGSFQPEVSASSASMFDFNPRHAAVGDFNGDGKLDWISVGEDTF